MATVWPRSRKVDHGAAAVAAQADGAGDDDAHGEHRGDGRVDGIAAGLEDFEAGGGAEWMAGGDGCRVCDDLTRRFDREARNLGVGRVFKAEGTRLALSVFLKPSVRTSF